MRTVNSSRFKILILIVLTSLVYTQSDAQLRRKQIIAENKALSRKSEKNVVLIDTRTLNNLMTKCMALGIENVQLVFTRIRPNDMDEYISNHPEASGFEKDIIGKLTVLVKVEGDNISEGDFVTDSPNNQKISLINTMNSVGFVKVNKPYGNIPSAMRALYFEVGSICPPPNSCN